MKKREYHCIREGANPYDMSAWSVERMTRAEVKRKRDEGFICIEIGRK